MTKKGKEKGGEDRGKTICYYHIHIYHISEYWSSRQSKAKQSVSLELDLGFREMERKASQIIFHFDLDDARMEQF